MIADIRDRLVQLATSFVGCSAAPESRERYISLVGPDEPKAMQAAMTTAIDQHTGMPGMSGCALVVRGLWRMAGLRHPKLTAPYRTGMAVTDVFSIGAGVGAIVHGAALAKRRPLPGDVVCVGGAGGGGVEHVFVVTSCDGDRLESVDGGQRMAAANPAERWELIDARQRVWTIEGGAAWDRGHASSDPGGGTKRKVAWMVDVSLLPWPPCSSLPPAA